MGGNVGTKMRRIRSVYLVGTRALLPTVGLALGACTNHPDEGTVVEPAPGVEAVPGDGQKIQAAPARPIMGGTLTTNREGTIAVASDPDRDAVFVVDLARRAVTPIALDSGEVPGRVVVDSGSNAYVVLRDAAAVAHIDLDRERLVARYKVCDEPRGLALEEPRGLLHVACQSGTLVSLNVTSGEVVRQVAVADDLRDVVVSDDRLVLTTFRSAEIIVLDADGNVEQRTSPAKVNGVSRPSVAWRAVAGADGDVHIVHQMADTAVGVSTQASGYGSGAGTCSFSIVRPALTTFTRRAGAAGTVSPPIELLGSAGPTDLAVSAQGRVAVVVAGNAWTDSTSVRRFSSFAVTEDCLPTEPSPGEPVAVTFDAHETTIVQSREPAALYLEDGSVIALSSESRANTGLALFHMNTGSGIACASCHPEGMDDGQTWNFAETSWRRTQNVAGGIAQRAPYHWEGDMEDFSMLVNEVMVGRMNLQIAPTDAQQEAFLGWVDSVARPAARFGDPDAAARGKALFFDSEIGCDDCHTGPQLTNRAIFDVGTGGFFVVPSLVGIAARAPYLHDGCAATLRDRFSACGGGDRHGKTSHLSAAEIDDLVTYLETL